MARFAAGEPSAVAEVYRTYGRLVYAVSYGILGDANLAEDATRQTFLQAWRLAGTLDPGRPLEPRLTYVAIRTAKEVLRRNRGRRRRGNFARAVTTPSEPMRPATRGHDVWLVRQALDTLPEQDRELIRLEHDQQLTPTEISDRLAIPPRAVHYRSREAHRRLVGRLHDLRDDQASVTPLCTDT